MKILIVQQKMIGDVLTSTILCEQLKKSLPQAQIHYLINKNTEAVVAGNPNIDQIIFFEPAYRESKLALFHFLRSIRKERYDVVIDVYSKLESMLISLFSRAAIRISYHKWYSEFLYTHTHKYVRSGETRWGLAIENRLALLDPIVPSGELTASPPKIYLNEAEVQEGKSFLLGKEVDFSLPIFMINVLGSSANKTYPLPYMAQVLDTLAEQGPANILFNYIPSQIAEMNQVYNLCAPKTQKMIQLEVFAPSLRSFLGLLVHCTALVGNEGGAVNMAKALNIPAFSIFSPWVPKLVWETFPENPANQAIHLADYRPELFRDKKVKQLKNTAAELYLLLKPSLFTTQLKQFLTSKAVAGQSQTDLPTKRQKTQ